VVSQGSRQKTGKRKKPEPEEKGMNVTKVRGDERVKNRGRGRKGREARVELVDASWAASRQVRVASKR